MARPLILVAVAAALVSPRSLAAQDPLVRSLEELAERYRQNMIATAQLLDDELYGFQPTEEVRSAGRILAHVANTEITFCALGAGEDRPTDEDLEESRTTRAEIIAGLEEAAAYCERVYEALTDEELSEERILFGNPTTALGVLVFNASHTANHYGNLVTYMRLNGIVPPTSSVPSVPVAEADLDPVDPDPGAVDRFGGRYQAGEDTVSVFPEAGMLHVEPLQAGWPSFALVPLADGTFALGLYEDGQLVRVYLPGSRIRFLTDDDGVVGFQMFRDGETLLEAARIP
ncbi:MAG: DinB family protein [Akkermansiaceae bacterium]|nr:DinB family protein [Akkermansiaceae bacterium]NIT86806.1 DinB family protein [Gemmatimonadota bacterium]NIU30679.1 DinB family protein [Gemmatimonadota bacterium]NIW63733.1 DUF664 domain-containing protein [Gemmatimonadota bacterium]NIX39060.1 DUF664 domain-containing protein [Gemmatimonadota bacterium]